MDDENQVGGLSQARPATPVLAQANVPAASPQPVLSPVDIATKAYQDERKKLIDIQNQLLASLESRVGGGPQEMFMAMAQGFGAPTKTGSFGESLGYASKAMGDVIERGKKGQFDIAKLRAELAAQQLGFKKEDIELAKAQQMKDALRQMVGGSGQPMGSTAAIGGPGQQGGLIPASVAPIVRFMLEMDPSSALKYIADIARDDAKRPDAVKALDTYLNMLPLDQRPAARAYAVRAGIFGKPEDKVAAEVKYREMAAAQQISWDEANRRIAELYGYGAPTAQQASPAAPAAPVSGVQTPPAAPASVSPTQTPSVSTAQPAITQATPEGPRPFIPKTSQQIATETKELEGGVKGRQEAIDRLRSSFEFSGDMINSANEAINIAQTSPRVFQMLLNKPLQDGSTVGNFIQKQWQTVKALADKGITTPWGSLTLPARILDEANLNPSERAALQKFSQIESQFTLIARTSWLKGQGQVSNMEGQIAALLGPQVSDLPEVVMMKAEAIREKAKFEQKVFKAWSDYESKGRGNFDNFLASNEYDSLRNSYDSRVRSMIKANSDYFKSIGRM